ncbi:hypothetical protein ACEN2I_18020 [Flavobacterium sp. W22_SRS_FK3]|uniref:hypothetical protein n=1 Tax=Flavobacterium sp. W22_SRS_FK3 TaxID=3240275 RepID=UPI003F8EF07C
MEKLSIICIKILQTLSGRYGMSYTLEELTSVLFPVFNVTATLKIHISNEMENQARVLEALMVLNDNGYIFLNTITDKSVITIKGLIKVNNLIFCN